MARDGVSSFGAGTLEPRVWEMQGERPGGYVPYSDGGMGT